MQTKMKMFFRTMLLALIGCAIGSCSGEDGEITGTYNLTKISSANCDDPLENLTFDFASDGGCTDFGGIEICGQGTITINEDMTFVVSLTLTTDGDSISETINGSYTDNGDSITICDGGECGTGTFSGDRIMLTFPDKDTGCDLSYQGKKN